MFGKIAYFIILGKPLVFYMGIITYFSLLFTASIPLMRKRGINAIPFKWHPRMAITTVIMATIHGLLAVLAGFGL